MYFKEEPKDGRNYKKILVDDKIFYKLDLKEKTPEKKKKRYSDSLKDPLYSQQLLYKKLKMIQQFREKNGDLEDLIEKWKCIISDCIFVMKKDYEVPVSDIFKIFNLETYGFQLEDYE